MNEILDEPSSENSTPKWASKWKNANGDLSSLPSVKMEETNINYHKFEGETATMMRGRSKRTFQTSDRNLLEGVEKVASNGELKRIAELRTSAVEHIVQRNRLIDVAGKMKANSKIRGDQEIMSHNH